MRSVLSYPFFVASLEFVAKESLTVGRTRNPDCERGRALGKLELRLGLGGMCWGDLCPNDTLCASNLTWARTSFWGRCAQPVKTHLSLIGNSIDFSFARRISHSSVKLTITASANVQCDWRQLNTAINGDVTESEKFAQTLDTKNGLETAGNSAA